MTESLDVSGVMANWAIRKEIEYKCHVCGAKLANASSLIIVAQPEPRAFAVKQCDQCASVQLFDYAVIYHHVTREVYKCP